MPHILVATDLSPRADRALARAFRLARNHGASLTALNVIDSDLPDKLTAPLVEDAQKHLEEFCASQDAANVVDWSVKTVTGDPSSDIHVAAVQTKADLIVLGLHRRRALFDALRETTLERLVRTATRPVLLVAAPADHDYKQAVAAVDASSAASAALTAVRQWAPGAEIHAFHAVYTGLGGSMARDPEHIMGEALVRDTEHQIRVWASSGGLPAGVAEPEVIEGALNAVFAAELTKRSADLVVLGAHARHGLAHRVLGGFARDLVRDPPTDLLIGKPA